MEDNVGHLGSLEGQSLLVKAKSLSDYLGISSDANVELRRESINLTMKLMVAKLKNCQKGTGLVISLPLVVQRML